MVFSLLLSFAWSHYIIATFLGFLLTWFLLGEKKRNLPPGPPCLPLIGNLHLMGGELHTAMFNMSEKYGDLCRLYLGKQLFVLVSGRTLFSKMFSSQSTQFSKRPPDFMAGQYLSKGKSFIFTHNISVEEHKKQKLIAMEAIKKTEKLFLMNAAEDHKQKAEFRSFSCLERIFSEEAIELGHQLVKLGKKYKGKYKLGTEEKQEYTSKVAKLSVLASICSLCPVICGKKLSSEEVQKTADVMRDLQATYNKVGLFAMFPFLKTFWKTPLTTYANQTEIFESFAEEYIAFAERKAKRGTGDDAQNNDYTISNSVLDNILKIKAEGQHENWDDLTTLSLIQGIFGAGFDTFSVLSRWLFVYLGVFPIETKRARDEVDEFVKEHQHLPSYSDRYDLPYVMAYLTEVVRQSSFMPFTVPHSAIEDTMVGNYLIPKEANILFNFMSLNYDSEVWEDEHTFRPERFIKEDNSFNLTLAEKVNIHGAGRRVCPGMNMSKIQDFVALSSLLHTFECKPIDQNDPKLPPSTMVISLTPKVFNVQVFELQKM